MSIRLMLADDHRMLRDTLRRSMEDEGFDVVAEASDGLEAVSLALEHQPDVVLMDVTMPEFDGVEATRRIVEQAPDTRVVMLTMHADRDVVAAAIRAGAVGYLVKDVGFDEMAETVRQAASPDASVSAGLAASMLSEVADLSEGDDAVISKREIEVLQHIADGCSTPEVAEKLYISQKTVKNHLASIYGKLDARDRTQAVLHAVRMGIIRLY
ncbi:MAG: response regulator transcription factor [Acidimicrobiales bacterium]|nr:response regulator transcription factor [Acidimicrobiales bacterium]